LNDESVQSRKKKANSPRFEFRINRPVAPQSPHSPAEIEPINRVENMKGVLDEDYDDGLFKSQSSRDLKRYSFMAFDSLFNKLKVLTFIASSWQ
jgi:hypothetical protein